MALTKKVVLVTGGTGALGQSLVQRFMNEDCKVVSTFISSPPEINGETSTKNRIDFIKADISSEQEVKALFAEVLRRHQRIDIVVNTVGGFAGGKTVRETPLADWNRMMSLNLTTAFLCTREALIRMRGNEYGRIINITAMVALLPTSGKSAYAVSKAGVKLLTEIAALEEKGAGVTVNAIAPSIIATPANLKAMPNEDSTKWVKPEDIADMVCYLCSDAARAITGTTIRAFGGV